MSARTTDRSAHVLPIIRARIEDAVRAGALLIENQAKANAPVRTGTLRRSITTEVKTVQDRVIAKIGPQVDYGIYVELGTRHMAARPYLRPALESRRDEAIALIRRALRAA